MLSGNRGAQWGLLLVVAALAAVVGACSDDDPDVGTSATSATTAVPGPEAARNLELVAEGKLTACTDVPRPPFELEQDGQLDGIDIELVRALAGRLALTAEFEDVDGPGLFAALDAGRCDVVASSVVITDERRATVEFTDAYFRIDQSLLVRKGDEGTYDQLAALRGRTLGVQTGTTGAAFAKESAEGATVRELPGPDDLFAALQAGQVDAVLHDLPVNAHHALTTGATVVATTFPEADDVEYGLALRKGNTALKAALDDALVQVKSDDTYPTILRRFLGDTAGQI